MRSEATFFEMGIYYLSPSVTRTRHRHASHISMRQVILRLLTLSFSLTIPERKERLLVVYLIYITLAIGVILSFLFLRTGNIILRNSQKVAQ